MPLYRFNLEDHRFIADRGVRECLDDEHAKEIANEIADIWCKANPSYWPAVMPLLSAVGAIDRN
jgi:hypothetical protein